MSYLLSALALIALIIVVEKAVLVHAKMYLSIALNADDNVKGPYLFEPRWRLFIYAAYLAGGVIALEGLVPRVIGFALILLPIIALVTLDVIALRRTWAKQTRSR